MGQRKYKNILKLRRTPDPIERRENLYKEVLKDSTPLPQTLEYVDIDAAFKAWVEKDLAISFEGKELPTVALFSSQRFSEYVETWQNSDDQKNMLMNFKVVTRENNPQPGTLHDKNMNIPGERTYLMKRTITQDANGRIYNIDYRMKQPFCVDLMYDITLITNKYQLLNKFNMLVNKKFCAIQCYIRPNGHYIPMKLESISDESEYSMDDRQYFAQTYKIRVMAYIIQEDDMVVEETPVLRIQCTEPMENNGASVEIEEVECEPHNPYYYQPLILRATFHECESKVKFKLNTDFDFVITGYSVSRELKDKLTINGVKIEEGEEYRLTCGKEVVIEIEKYVRSDTGVLTINGYNPDLVFDEREDKQEVPMDNTNHGEELIINESTDAEN